MFPWNNFVSGGALGNFPLVFLLDNIETSRYIQLQVIREFGLPDEISDEIFQQKPDLIEDSDSATSSKHSTLNKVSFIVLKLILFDYL